MTSHLDIDLARIDLSDVQLFSGGPPHDVFAQLRSQAPVHWNGSADPVLQYWSVTRYHDIAKVNQDFERFSSAEGGVNIKSDTLMPFEMAQNAMINADPPRHSKLRGIVQKVFTAHAVAQREDHIREVTNRYIDELIDRREFDFVRDFAVPLPLVIIAEMLGVPVDDQPQLFDWTNRLASDDPDVRGNPEDDVKAIGEMGMYLFGFVNDRRNNPTDDLISRLTQAEVDGERLDDIELTINFFLLMGAGNETTRNTFAGGMLALIDHPDERRKLIANPSLIPGAVEEILRYHSTVMHQRRTAMCDTEIAGMPVARGDKVVMWLTSGNRDERAFDDPDRFDVTRVQGRHQAFGGGGRHFCIGNQLARLELSIMLAEALRRMPDLELAGPVRRSRTNLFNGILELPVRVSS